MRADEQQADTGLVPMGRAGNTRRSPLSVVLRYWVYPTVVHRKSPGLPREIRGVSDSGLSEPQGESIVSRKSAEGMTSHGQCPGMAEILWHRRESRRLTENTNICLEPGNPMAQGPNGPQPNGLGK